MCHDPTQGAQWLVKDIADFVETDDDEAILQTIEMRLKRQAELGMPPPSLVTRIEQEMVCLCDESHANRPPERKGCGAFWTLVAEF